MAGELVSGIQKFRAGKQRHSASKKAMEQMLEAVEAERERLGGSFGELQDLNQQLSQGVRGDLATGFEQGQDLLSGFGGKGSRQLELGLSGATEALRSGFGGAGNVLQSAANRGRFQAGGGPGGLGRLDLSDFETSPGFEFRRDQGEGAINRLASARGGRVSGRTLQELAKFNQGLAAEEFDKFRQQRLAERGQDLSARGQDVTVRAQDVQTGLTNQATLDALAQGQAGLLAQGGQALSEAELRGRGALADALFAQGQNEANLAVGQGQALAGATQGQLSNALSLGTAQNQLSAGLLGAQTGAIGLPTRTAGGAAQAMGESADELTVGGALEDVKGII